jgi:hypothetical protein
VHRTIATHKIIATQDNDLEVQSSKKPSKESDEASVKQPCDMPVPSAKPAQKRRIVATKAARINAPNRSKTKKPNIHATLENAEVGKMFLLLIAGIFCYSVLKQHTKFDTSPSLTTPLPLVML